MSESTDSSALAMAISNSVSKNFTKIEKALSTHLESSSSLLSSVIDEFLECADTLCFSASLISSSANTILTSARHLTTSSGILAASTNALMSVNSARGDNPANDQKSRKDGDSSGSWVDTAKNAYKEAKSLLDMARSISNEANGLKNAWQGKGRHKGEKSRGKRLLNWLLDRDPTKSSQDASVAELAFKDSGIQKVFVVNWPDNLSGGINIDLDLDLPGKKNKKRKRSRRTTPKRRKDAPDSKQGKSRSRNSYKTNQVDPLRKSETAKEPILRKTQERPAAIESAQKKTPASVRNEKRTSALDKTSKGQSGLEETTQKPASTNSTKRAPVASEFTKKPQGITKSGKPASSAAKGGWWSRLTNWAGEAAGKNLGKVLKGAKFVAKKIPGVSLVAGGIAAANRAMEGDWVGALGEAASGVAGMVPGAGTAVSTFIDAALIAHDMNRETTRKDSNDKDQNNKTPSDQAKSHSPNTNREPTPTKRSVPSALDPVPDKNTLLRQGNFAPALQADFAAANGTGLGMGAGFNITINQSVSVGSGAEVQQVQTAMNEANTKAQNDWEGIVANLFRDQRRVEYGATSGIA